jgi:hypothetical protein
VSTGDPGGPVLSTGYYELPFGQPIAERPRMPETPVTRTLFALTVPARARVTWT